MMGFARPSWLVSRVRAIDCVTNVTKSPASHTRRSSESCLGRCCAGKRSPSGCTASQLPKTSCVDRGSTSSHTPPTVKAYKRRTATPREEFVAEFIAAFVADGECADLARTAMVCRNDASAGASADASTEARRFERAPSQARASV